MVTEVVLPTLAVAGIWGLLAALLAGGGWIVRRALLRASAPGLASGDIWIGLAALGAYLVIWNLLLAITWWTWILPLAGGVSGIAIGGRRRRWPRLDRRAAAVASAVGAGWIYLANVALGPIQDYDFGLYHADLISYAERYRTVLGLANLHERLGAGDVHLLLAAFLDQKPLAGAGPHLINGLLVALLFLEVGVRLLRPSPDGMPSFTRRLAVLLPPAAIALIGAAPEQRLTSPNLDLAAFTLVAAGLLYLADSVEAGFRAQSAVTATATLGLAAATRPLYWPVTGFAIIVFAIGAARNKGLSVRAVLRAAGPVVIMPLVLAIAWAGRQAVLSGYPLFPLTIGGLSADWRVPAAVVDAQTRVDDAWARIPGADPTTVLSSWHWLHEYWLAKRVRDLDVMAPLTLVACVVPVIVGLGTWDPGRRRRVLPMLAVVAPSALTLVVWFFTAPDPRFAWAPIWLVPAGLVAWALPPFRRLSARWLLAFVGATGLAALVLALIGIYHIIWIAPAAVIGWAVIAVLAGRRAAPFVAWGAALSVIVAGASIGLNNGRVHTSRANGKGPLGMPLLPPPSLIAVTTSAGLQLSQPVNGGDQCFAVTLCVPYTPNPRLHLRGRTVAQGFSVEP